MMRLTAARRSAAAPPGRQAGRVRTMVVLPADPESMAIGGIASFIRGFVKFAPPDFDISFVGVSSTRPLGHWQKVELEGREMQFMPVSRGRAESRTHVPLALGFVAGLIRHRRRLHLGDRVLSFHRPGTDLPFMFARARKWRVVHLSVKDLTTAGSESRWRTIPRLLAAIETRSFRRMDRIYVVNERVAADYRSRFPEVAGRIRYLPNWADPTIFAMQPEDARATTRLAIATELSLPPSGPLLLFAGRLEGQKNPRLLAETFAEVRSRRPSAYLIVAGNGSLEAALRDTLASLRVQDATRFIGTVSRSRLAMLMNACDVQVITSRYETGPTVGFESLACGLPIATTNVGQVARLIEAGGAGQVVDEHSPAALANAIEWIIDQPADRLRTAATATAQPYLADQVLRQIYDDSRELARPPSAYDPELDRS